jgi:anaerobic dimethyl sulfoxide reductase subunit B (iron-sulfur subunit)
MQYGFFFDETRCLGCNVCTVACKDYNQVNPGPVRWRRQDYNKKTDSENNPVIHSFVMSCNHCDVPACVNACSVGAIKKYDNGLVLVDRTKCQNLRLCITACPFAAPQIAGDYQESDRHIDWLVAHPVQKCKGCWELLEKGEHPICVSGCPVNAVQFGEVAELQRKYSDAVRLNKADFPYAYRNSAALDNTMPNLFVRKRESGRKLAVIANSKRDNWDRY